ncbi:MAG: acyl carrier protein [Tatlockia sp.]|nr:acyl carrier protein [Tatlockia sp.]
MSKERFIEVIKAELALETGQAIEQIQTDVNFLRLGISSIQILKIINRIKHKINLDISPAAMFEYKTIREFSEYLETLEEELIAG